MDALNFLKIANNWIVTGVVWGLVLVLLVLTIRYWSRIKNFIGEVKAELRKANWPWESDPKIKGFRKYKELIDSTAVVLIAMVLLAGFVQFWDLLIVLIVTTSTSH